MSDSTKNVTDGNDEEVINDAPEDRVRFWKRQAEEAEERERRLERALRELVEMAPEPTRTGRYSMALDRARSLSEPTAKPMADELPEGGLEAALRDLIRRWKNNELSWQDGVAELEALLAAPEESK